MHAVYYIVLFVYLETMLKRRESLGERVIPPYIRDKDKLLNVVDTNRIVRTNSSIC
jgi:hypothetical protein